MLYSLLLLIHSWMRWAVLAAGLAALYRALSGRRQPWTLADERAGFWFILAVDIQFLLGLLLYFVFSPYTQPAFDNFGAAMRMPELRFWAVEHLFGMVVAVALAHIGRIRTRRAATDAKRHRTAAIFYGLALVAIIAAIPWPGLPNERPLFRFGG